MYKMFLVICPTNKSHSIKAEKLDVFRKLLMSKILEYIIYIDKSWMSF